VAENELALSQILPTQTVVTYPQSTPYEVGKEASLRLMFPNLDIEYRSIIYFPKGVLFWNLHVKELK